MSEERAADAPAGAINDASEQARKLSSPLPNDQAAAADTSQDQQLPQPDEQSPSMHVVLYQPEIPQNTGNIGRTCLSLNAKLWIVRPAGFQFDSAKLKRAGMDYWVHVNWEAIDSWQELTNRLQGRRFWLITKFGEQAYTDVGFERGDVLVFGRESSGLPDSIHQAHSENRLTIPMFGPVRSLNLATSAGIVMYELARQTGMLRAILSDAAS